MTSPDVIETSAAEPCPIPRRRSCGSPRGRTVLFLDSALPRSAAGALFVPCRRSVRVSSKSPADGSDATRPSLAARLSRYAGDDRCPTCRRFKAARPGCSATTWADRWNALPPPRYRRVPDARRWRSAVRRRPRRSIMSTIGPGSSRRLSRNRAAPRDAVRAPSGSTVSRVARASRAGRSPPTAEPANARRSPNSRRSSPCRARRA